MTFTLDAAMPAVPSPEFDERFAHALTTVRSHLGAEHPMLIGGSDERARLQYEVRAPADTRVLLGRFQAGDDAHASAAVDAARRAFPEWSRRPWQERVALLRAAIRRIEERAFEIAAALALEGGKGGPDALAETRQAMGLMAQACDEMEARDGFVRSFPDETPRGFVVSRRSVATGCGVWVVLAPFDHPFAYAAGPATAALVAGNAVVLKPASATPWSARLFALALRDAGVPPGVFNGVCGPGRAIGQALVVHRDVAGVTFHGTRETGLHLARTLALAPWPRPFVAGMGGRSAAVVTRRASLADAAQGVARSAFALAGQACAACSRVFVEHTVFNDFVAELHRVTRRIEVGDPAGRAVAMGPLIDDAAVARFEDAVATIRSLGDGGAIVAGGARLEGHEYAHGGYVTPTIARLADGHPLWQRELLVPLVLVAPVDDLDAGIAKANEGGDGLAAGFYGAEDEAERFLARIEAGAAFVNRPQGATTPAWPDPMPLGGWRAAGALAKGVGSDLHLSQYLREQARTRVVRR